MRYPPVIVSDVQLVEWQREIEVLYRQQGYFDDADRVREVADALTAEKRLQTLKECLTNLACRA